MKQSRHPTVWALPVAWHMLVTAVLRCLQLSLRLSGHLVPPVPLLCRLLHTGSAWEHACPGGALGSSYSTVANVLG